MGIEQVQNLSHVETENSNTPKLFNYFKWVVIKKIVELFVTRLQRCIELEVDSIGTSIIHSIINYFSFKIFIKNKCKILC